MIASYTYTYSDGFVGGYNQISKTETKNGASAETTAYEYDAWGRLIKVTHPSGTVNAYTYDKAGNRLSKVSSKDGIIATNVYSYDEQNRLTETVATTNGSSAEVHTYFGYDNNGNQISKWVQSVGVSDGENSVTLGELGVNAADGMALYSYDNFNRLTGILQGNTTIQNAYNGRGRKISRTTDGETRYYVYDGNTVIAELDGQNELKARNVYGRNLISRTTDKPMIMSYNGHGDIVLVKSVSGETLAEYAYDEFGNPLSDGISLQFTIEPVESADEKTDYSQEIDNPYRYAGYEYLDSVDLYDLNARYYNPKTARFLSEDPYFNLGNRVIGLYEINVPSVDSIIQANNIYAYCGNNPVIYIDENGEVFFLVTAAIGAVAGGIGGAIYSQVKYGEVRWQNVAAGAAIGGVIGATGGAAVAYIATGSATASTATVIVGIGGSATAAAGGAGIATATSKISEKAPEIGSKLDFIFGRATGNLHNIQRSTDMLRQLNRIGIFDNDAGRNYVASKIAEAYYYATPTLQNNGRVLREILVMGPQGGVKLETIWEDTKLITAKLIGG